MIRVLDMGARREERADSTEGKAAGARKPLARAGGRKRRARAARASPREAAPAPRVRPLSRRVARARRAARRPGRRARARSAPRPRAAARKPGARGERVDVGRIVAQRGDDRARGGVGLAARPGAAAARRARVAGTPSSSRMSCAVSTSFAPSRISLWQPFENGEWIEPGSAKTSRPCSPARRAVMSEPDDSVASTTSTPRARPLTRRLRRGKFCLQRRRSQREFGEESAALRELVREVAIARRIDAIEPGADDGDAARRRAPGRRDAPRRRCRARGR